MPQLERSRQRVYESHFRLSRPRSWALHVIPWHQLLGVGMQIHLLVLPVRRRIAVQGRAPRARLGRSRPTKGGSGFCTTSRENMPVPLRCAMPCSPAPEACAKVL